MNFNKILKSLFGDKSTRDMKLIQPLVEEVKKVYPEIQQLSNDALRAKTKELQQYVRKAAEEQNKQIEALKEEVEKTPIDQREEIFNHIDKLEKEVLDRYEVALNEVMPTAFSIIKDTARRCTMMCNCLVVLHSTREKSPRWPRVKVRLWWQRCRYSSTL